MKKARRIVIDCKTGKKRVEYFDHTETQPEPEPEPIDLNDLRKLIQYAKKRGWIK